MRACHVENTTKKATICFAPTNLLRWFVMQMGGSKSYERKLAQQNLGRNRQRRETWIRWCLHFIITVFLTDSGMTAEIRWRTSIVILPRRSVLYSVILLYSVSCTMRQNCNTEPLALRQGSLAIQGEFGGVRKTCCGARRTTSSVPLVWPEH